MDFLALLSRWTHILSMTFLVGGPLYAWFVLATPLGGMAAAERRKWEDAAAARIRSIGLLFLTLAIASGLYNLLHKVNLPKGYHMWFGIKMLFVLHIIAVTVLLGRAGVDPAKRARWSTGLAVSGAIVLLLSAYLRAMQL